VIDPSVADALMAIALDEARAALVHADVPIGAVVARVDTGEVLARRHNERERLGDPTAHAEVLALVCTLEPCPMCAGAALSARVPVVVFGAADAKAGALGSLYHLGADPRLNHDIAVVHGVRADESAELLREFFAQHRNPAGSDGTPTP
jgi:tRNA(adenine34) deaminase